MRTDAQWRSIRERTSAILSGHIKYRINPQTYRLDDLPMHDMQIVEKLGVLATNPRPAETESSLGNAGGSIIVGSEQWIKNGNFLPHRFNLYKILVLRFVHWTIYALMKAIQTKYEITSFANDFDDYDFDNSYEHIIRICGFNKIIDDICWPNHDKMKVYETTYYREDEKWVIAEMVEFSKLHHKLRDLQPSQPQLRAELNQRYLVLERNVIRRAELLATNQKITRLKHISSIIFELLAEFRDFLEKCEKKGCAKDQIGNTQNSVVLLKLKRISKNHNQSGADVPFLMNELHRTKRISVDENFEESYQDLIILHRKRDLIFVVLNALFIEKLCANQIPKV